MAKKITPRTACRHLRDIEDPRAMFHTMDGAHLKNMIELFHYLKNCSDDDFKQHVTETYNHFSSWVYEVLRDSSLAFELSLYREKNPMRITVMKRVNHLVHHATREPELTEKARMILEETQLPEEEFVSRDGTCIRSLHELRDFLENVEEGVLSHHVSPAGNDFAAWVRNVLMDSELAADMEARQDRQSMLDLVSQRLCSLNQVLEV